MSCIAIEEKIDTNNENVNIANQSDDKSKEDCLIWVGKKKGTKKNLQEHFAKFRKQRMDSNRLKQELKAKSQTLRKHPEFKEKLRQRFLEVAKSYIGVPYAKRYHNPGDKYYDAPLFLDCCALVRRVVADLKEEFGFVLAGWNQAYQVDTLPVDVKFEDLKPGDLIFYSATYYNEKLRPQKHDMVHVEIFIGGETGEQSLGARWQKGAVQIFDSYKFQSTSYYDIKFHYKSIDTWLEGVCKSHCKDHKWVASTLDWEHKTKSIFAENGDTYDENDIDTVGA